jgi:flagellin
LSAETTRLNTATQFNGTSVFAATQTFQVGANAGETITTASVVGATAGGSVSDVATASAAVAAIDTALAGANTNRATLGAIQNRFASVVSNLQVSVENQTAAKSRIMDADFAVETANLTRGQILQQAGTAMLAQANSLPNGVLALLRG